MSQYINNLWSHGSGDEFASVDPATGSILWQNKAADKNDVDAAVKAARTAFGPWSSKSLDERINYLNAFAEALRKNQEKLALTISQETGKPLWESKGEVSSMINKVKISIDAYHKRCPDIIKDQPTVKSITRHRPHGVIGVLGPFNFPGHLPNGHIVPALLAGNTVIFKPSEFTPMVGEATLKCWEEANLPPGVMNLVQGGKETGQYLAYHPHIDGLFFTGSYPTGKLLATHFAQNPGKILALEMGGNNPLIVSKIDDLETAAFLTIQSSFITSGQRCSCARRLIVMNNAQGSKFIDKLLEMVNQITVGKYSDVPEPYMGPVISEKTAMHLMTKQESLIELGGKPLVPMHHLKKGTGFLLPGIIDMTHATSRPDVEIFGPLLQLIRVSSLEEAIQEANRTAYGLTAGLFSTSKEEYDQFYQGIRAGIVNWNTQLTGASSEAPFGGVGCSGNYHPSAYYAADYCAFPVASMESPNLQRPASPPPGLKFN